ncbi:MAG TPA: HAD-IIIA family hydrolase [Saprospiraceae bacterium]|nr:HAD-IIIA family hydrolase [Saprospiraceae bacterium]
MSSSPALNRFKQIKTFIFDIDGVFTDNTIHINEQGEMLRTMNVRDGYAIKKAISKGYEIIIITGGSSIGTSKRMQFLGIKEVHSGIQDKLSLYLELISKKNLKEEEILYMGDDLPDYKVMQRVGLACCPIDSVPEIIAISHYISPLAGGKTCVRDVIERVLKLNDHWEY